MQISEFESGAMQLVELQDLPGFHIELQDLPGLDIETSYPALAAFLSKERSLLYTGLMQDPGRWF